MVVGGIEAEVDDVGTVGGVGRKVGVGEVAVDRECAGWDVSSTATGDDDVVARVEQLAGDMGADLAGPEDHVAAHHSAVVVAGTYMAVSLC